MFENVLSEDQDWSYGDEYDGDEQQINPTIDADYVSFLDDFGKLLNDGKSYGARKEVTIQGTELLVAAYFIARPYEKERVHDLDYIRDPDAFVQIINEIEDRQHPLLSKVAEEMAGNQDTDSTDSDSHPDEHLEQHETGSLLEVLKEVHDDVERLTEVIEQTQATNTTDEKDQGEEIKVDTKVPDNE